jgi:short-subunit dehydrogenase
MPIKTDNILLIGACSKICERFINEYFNDYNLYGTYHIKKPSQKDRLKKLIQLDMHNVDNLTKFMHEIKEIEFKAVIFFASTYTKDQSDSKDYLSQLVSDININVISPTFIAKNLNIKKNELGRIIFLSDSGIKVPKAHYTSYINTKIIIESMIKNLAVEMEKKAIVTSFRLGPTLCDVDVKNKKQYYNKNLINVPDASKGLVEYIEFIINNKNLNITGNSIDYDGGAYIKRSKSFQEAPMERD